MPGSSKNSPKLPPNREKALSSLLTALHDTAARNRPTWTSHANSSPSVAVTTRALESGDQFSELTSQELPHIPGCILPLTSCPSATLHTPSAPLSPAAAIIVPLGLNCTSVNAPVVLRRCILTPFSTSHTRHIRSPPAEARSFPVPGEKATACTKLPWLPTHCRSPCPSASRLHTATVWSAEAEAIRVEHGQSAMSSTESWWVPSRSVRLRSRLAMWLAMLRDCMIATSPFAFESFGTSFSTSSSRTTWRLGLFHMFHTLTVLSIDAVATNRPSLSTLIFRM
mmetsp:Transcript_46211/g.108447  ORF Transcript_46211/g.108447 Transcript_46211/m.108447 type:complete len:282 (+) Transcript_46211:1275-2120(+)